MHFMKRSCKGLSSCPVSSSLFWNFTLPTAELISAKNLQAWVSYKNHNIKEKIFLQNSTANFHPNWAGLAVLFNRHILIGYQDFLFSLTYLFFKYKIIENHACAFLSLIISAVGLKCSLLQWVCKNLYNHVVLQTAYWVSGIRQFDETAVWKSLTQVMNLFNLFTGNFCKTIFHSFSNGCLTWPWINVMVRNLFWFWMIEHIILLTILHSIKLLSSSSSLICSIRWGNLRHISSMMYVIKELRWKSLSLNFRWTLNRLSRKRKSSCKNINTEVWPETDAIIFQKVPK